jgi:hypothetical protein
MRNGLQMPTTGAVVFHYRDAVRERRLGRGFGLIEDEIHALIEYTLHVDPASDADGGLRRVTTCHEVGGH